MNHYGDPNGKDADCQPTANKSFLVTEKNMFQKKKKKEGKREKKALHYGTVLSNL